MPGSVVGRRGYPASTRFVFWEGLRAGLSIPQAAAAAGVSADTGRGWLNQAGGVIPRLSTGRPGGLSFADRCRIQELVRQEEPWSPTRIAQALGRPVSTITRELDRGRDHHGGYVAMVGQVRVEANLKRPKPRKVELHQPLREELVQRLGLRHSPQQVAMRLRKDFPDDPRMWISVESVYQALYVQGKGSLADEVGKVLRTGRVRRKPQRPERKTRERRGKIPDMISISERPPEVEDRAVPGHWEGDLILGANNASAVGTLVERSTGFVMLLHLPGDHKAATVAAAMSAAVPRIPEILWRSLTWDQGKEMASHTAITEATGIPIYFCDPHSPWQRGTNENTNGLLRQYLPKGSDLSVHGPGILDNIAAELNARPRKRLNWDTPAEALEQLLSTHQTANMRRPPEVTSTP
jgi:transposase, IS30 family